MSVVEEGYLEHFFVFVVRRTRRPVFCVTSRFRETQNNICVLLRKNKKQGDDAYDVRRRWVMRVSGK